MHSTDIIAYVYRADMYHPKCMVHVLIGQREAGPAARDMDAESVLDQIAAANAIERQNERTFDSDEFPKVVFAGQIEEGESCGYCHEYIIGY